jgi:hypothetical protein
VSGRLLALALAHIRPSLAPAAAAHALAPCSPPHGLPFACRIVLAACSRFFRALFAGAWHSSGPSQPAPRGGLPRWSLSGVDGASLQLLLHAVYSKRLPLTGDDGAGEVALLLAAANYLEVLPVKEACCQLLRSRLSLASVAETLALAAAHDCAELAEEAVGGCAAARGGGRSGVHQMSGSWTPPPCWPSRRGRPLCWMLRTPKHPMLLPAPLPPLPTVAFL